MKQFPQLTSSTIKRSRTQLRKIPWVKMQRKILTYEINILLSSPNTNSQVSQPRERSGMISRSNIITGLQTQTFQIHFHFKNVFLTLKYAITFPFFVCQLQFSTILFLSGAVTSPQTADCIWPGLQSVLLFLLQKIDLLSFLQYAGLLSRY